MYDCLLIGDNNTSHPTIIFVSSDDSNNKGKRNAEYHRFANLSNVPAYDARYDEPSCGYNGHCWSINQ